MRMASGSKTPDSQLTRPENHTIGSSTRPPVDGAFGGCNGNEEIGRLAAESVAHVPAVGEARRVYASEVDVHVSASGHDPLSKQATTLELNMAELSRSTKRFSSVTAPMAPLIGEARRNLASEVKSN